MPLSKIALIAPLVGVALTACSSPDSANADATSNDTVVLRNLVETDSARPAPAGYRVEGDLIPTPSDTRSRYYLLRVRKTLPGTVIAIVRQERGDRIAYARTEADCGKGLFHVVGVADTRGRVETDVAHDGPLRSVKGLPLRQELGGYVCGRVGEKLIPA